MIEDVYEPLERYQNEFKDSFAKNAEEAFDELLKQSGVSPEENAQLVAEVNRLAKAKEAAENSKMWWGIAVFFCAILGFAGPIVAIWALSKPEDFSDTCRLVAYVSGGVGILLLILCLCKLRHKYAEAGARLDELTALLQQATQNAWNQMAPLNRLYDWSITPKLIEKTVPRLQFDPYFNEARLQDLYANFDWDDSYNQGRSIQNCLSGVLNGNPFVFAQSLAMSWGEHTYHGYLTIHWTEREKDSEGKWQTVRKSETLHATVTKPIPVYESQYLLLYGNDAAPKLTFTRAPSNLSGLEDGWFSNVRKKIAMGELKKFAENLDDDSNYTLMSNHDFELLFHSTDRSDEVQFRLLFTPLAQAQMVKLLKDKEVGYGDDFNFHKLGRLNVIGPQHLVESTINTDPRQYETYDLEAARKFFIERNCTLFKSLYFSMAPLLSIPLYQQTRTHEEIYRGIVPPRSATFWEYESMANYMGDTLFKHPECITQNILKTNLLQRKDDGSADVNVTAYGYRGEEHTEYVSVYGGDGKFHDVPVDWVEYLPVERTSTIGIAEFDGLTRPDFHANESEILSQVNAGGNSAAYMRNSIVAFLKNMG